MDKISKKWKWLLILIATFTALGIWAFVIEPGLISVNRANIEALRWYKNKPLKIAVLADLHVGAPHIDLEKLQHIVELTNKEKPDIIFLLGDYVIQGIVGGSFVQPREIAETLKDLNAPLGIISVLGNHDWWHDGEQISAQLKRVGIEVLENDAIKINNNGYPFWVGGVADMHTREWSLSEIMQKAEADQLPILLLTHHPDVFTKVPARIDLTLAGHTHGGQVNLPIFGRPIVPSEFGQRYAIGHIVEDGKQMYVSSGIGTSILPVRFRVVPEILIINLKSN